MYNGSHTPPGTPPPANPPQISAAHLLSKGEPKGESCRTSFSIIFQLRASMDFSAFLYYYILSGRLYILLSESSLLQDISICSLSLRAKAPAPLSHAHET